MNTLQNLAPLMLPITLFSHEKAQTFAYQHHSPQKVKQVYLNTLAVETVRVYLESLGVSVDLEASESFKRVCQTLADTGMLMLENGQKIECRPVLPDTEHCFIPPEVWCDRTGFLAIQFNSQLTQATLLGFLPKVEQELISLSEFEPLETVLEHIEETPKAENSKNDNIIQLSHWLNNKLEQGWQTLENLFIPQASELAFNFRGQQPQVSSRQGKIQQGKWIKLSPEEEQIALCVSVEPNHREMVDISVQVLPQHTKEFLPENLQLHLLDEVGQGVMQAEARTSEGLEFQFSGDRGERFMVKISVGDFTTTEHFEI